MLHQVSNRLRWAAPAVKAHPAASSSPSKVRGGTARFGTPACFPCAEGLPFLLVSLFLLASFTNSDRPGGFVTVAVALATNNSTELDSRPTCLLLTLIEMLFEDTKATIQVLVLWVP